MRFSPTLGESVRARSSPEGEPGPDVVGSGTHDASATTVTGTVALTRLDRRIEGAHLAQPPAVDSARIPGEVHAASADNALPIMLDSAISDVSDRCRSRTRIAALHGVRERYVDNAQLDHVWRVIDVSLC